MRIKKKKNEVKNSRLKIKIEWVLKFLSLLIKTWEFY